MYNAAILKKEIMKKVLIGAGISILCIIAAGIFIQQGRMAEKRMQDLWAQDLNNKDHHIYGRALNSLLTRQKVDVIFKFVTDKTKDTDQRIQCLVSFAPAFKFGKLDQDKKEKIINFLVSKPILWNEDHRIRFFTYQTLNEIGGRRAEEAIKKAKANDSWLFHPAFEELQSTDPSIKCVATTQLSALADTRTLEPLTAALEQEINKEQGSSVCIKFYAIWGIATILNEKKITYLPAESLLKKIALNEKDAYASEQAKKALAMINHK